MTASPSESELLAACRGGAGSLPRERAWDVFVQRYVRLVRAVVQRTADRLALATTAEDREDMAADVFVELLRGDAAVLARYEGRASFAAYLAVVVRRLVIRRVRARHRLVAPQPIEPVTEGGTRQVDDREEVARLLSTLDPDEARLVKLYHLEARSYGEISRITGMPINSVGPALSRARAKLRGPALVRIHDPGHSTSAESDPAIQRAGGASLTDGSARSTGS